MTPGRVGGLKLPVSLPPPQGFLCRALGFTLATGLEGTTKVEVLLLELLYKTDYSNDTRPGGAGAPWSLRGLGGCGVCMPVRVRVPVCLSVCGGAQRTGCPQHPASRPARWVLPQGVILCFGLCAGAR